jgi:hypothetical protein
MSSLWTPAPFDWGGTARKGRVDVGDLERPYSCHIMSYSTRKEVEKYRTANPHIQLVPSATKSQPFFPQEGT